MRNFVFWRFVEGNGKEGICHRRDWRDRDMRV